MLLVGALCVGIRSIGRGHFFSSTSVLFPCRAMLSGFCELNISLLPHPSQDQSKGLVGLIISIVPSSLLSPLSSPILFELFQLFLVPIKLGDQIKLIF